MPQERIPTPDSLRGLAAAAVAWFHFTNGNPALLPDDSLLRLSGRYGWLGVEVFFVISGFVVPFALARAGYAVPGFGRFLLKRFARLDPPYLASIAFVLLAIYITALFPDFQGQRFEFSWATLLPHLGYANAYFGRPWLNPVYWTLAVESQYYLIIGLVFPLVSGGRRAFYAVLAAGGLAAFLVRNPAFVFEYLPLFALGALTFRLRVCGESPRVFLCTAAALAVATSLSLGWPEAAAGLGAALAIAFVRLDSRPARFFGAISYSLYLLHVPVGSRVVNLFATFAPGLPLRCAAPFAALAASVCAAYVFNRLVERPAQRWSSSMKYPGPARAQQPPPAFVETRRA
ncbi:MAG: acyltransferase [Acidobacteria bacterium]|nr:acyltransferase [Acidobacteriota bacterium]